MSKGRNSQSSRQLVIHQMLQAAGTRGLSPAEITDQLTDRGYSVTKRTVHRDLEGLLAAGIPLTESGSKSDKGGVRWKVDISPRVARQSQAAVLKISQRQLAGLYLAKAQFKALSKNPLFAGLDHFFEQVSDLIGSRNRSLLDELAKDLHVDLSDAQVVDSDPDVVDTIHAAIGEGQCLRLHYKSSNSQTNRERELGPHYLYFRERSLYLVAEDLADQTIKTFALPRMSKVEMIDRTYAGKVSSPDEHFKSSFGVWRANQTEPVEILFIASRSQYIKERTWHPSQVLTSNTDGSIKLKLQVGITPQLVCWILGFGSDAKVLSPSKLQHLICKAAHDITSRYPKNAG
jgi:predicted DNA-binding transcriptional regulator YafY